MAQTFYPMANSPILTQEQWSKVAQNWIETGVIKGQLNELQVYADSTGMQVKVKSGQGYLKGHFFESDAEEVMAIGTANGTNPRIDRVVVRVDWVANTIQLAVLQGVAAVTPSAPALTQNTSRWEISLAQISVGANVSTIVAGNVTDERNFAGNQSAVIAQNSGVQNLSSGVTEKIVILTSEIIDKQSEWASSTFTAKTDGIYYVRAYLDWGSTIPSNSSVIYIYKNGSNYNTAVAVSPANIRYVIGSCMVQLNAGDKLELYVLQDSSGTAKTLVGARLEIGKLQ